jgi:hypothetical protein
MEYVQLTQDSVHVNERSVPIEGGEFLDHLNYF